MPGLSWVSCIPSLVTIVLRYVATAVQKPQGLMVWAAMNGRGELVLRRCPPKMKALDYQTILGSALSFIRRRYATLPDLLQPITNRYQLSTKPTWHRISYSSSVCRSSRVRFQQDGASVHKARSTARWLQDNHVRMFLGDQTFFCGLVQPPPSPRDGGWPSLTNHPYSDPPGGGSGDDTHMLFISTTIIGFQKKLRLVVSIGWVTRHTTPTFCPCNLVVPGWAPTPTPFETPFPCGNMGRKVCW